jgi:tetratricopeptide (TPR) repeat protein
MGKALSERKTAVLTLTLPGDNFTDTCALDRERIYLFSLTIDGKQQRGGEFKSPFGDESWRNIVRAIRESTEGMGNRTHLNLVRDAGRKIYDYLRNISPDLNRFLDEKGPRRLVIDSKRAEIHQLPWEAMVDPDWDSLAKSDLSVVHSIDGFDPTPDVSHNALYIQAIFGPNTERKTLDALTDLDKAAARQKDRGLLVNSRQGKTIPENWFDNLQADVVHIEAHGDPYTGEVELPEWAANSKGLADPVVLAQRLRKRKMVLLWSCYSAMVQPWGSSPALSLHAMQTSFVLSFFTPLRYKTSSDIASRFYRSIFTSRDLLDPESAVVEERKRLYETDLLSCDWASMVLWLRCPLDVSGVLKGPNLPQSDDTWAETVTKTRSLQRINKLFKEEVMRGRTVLLSNEGYQGPLPWSLGESYQGPSVYLRGKDSLRTREIEDIFKELGIESSQVKSHPADRFLKLFDTLATYPRSLLIWAGVTKREIQMIKLLPEMPKNLAFFLISPDSAEVTSAIAVSDYDGEPRTDEVPNPVAKLEDLVSFLDTELFKEAAALWLRLKANYPTEWSEKDRFRYYWCGYWSLIRVGGGKDAEERKKDAKECIERIEEIEKGDDNKSIEGLLLRGNFVHRNGLYNKARVIYANAWKMAQKVGNRRDQGRARLEQAYIAFEIKDHHLSEQYYRDAIDLLEQVENGQRDSLWSSALGRALRDYAHLLAGYAERAPESEAYLRRALAIHTLDGRRNQVAYCLQTRGKLARTLGDWEKAVSTFQTCASIFIENGNRAGWAFTVREMAEVSYQMKKYDQCLAIIKNALGQLGEGLDDYRVDCGRMALQAARVYWSLGKSKEAYDWCEKALKILPEGRRQERNDATRLQVFIGSLIDHAQVETEPAPAPHASE